MNIRDIIALAPVIPEPTLTDVALALPVVLPGVMTPTEVISARNSNFSVVKLFPAEQAGGVVPQALLMQADWPGIEALARDARSLARS